MENINIKTHLAVSKNNQHEIEIIESMNQTVTQYIIKKNEIIQKLVLQNLETEVLEKMLTQINEILAERKQTNERNND